MSYNQPPPKKSSKCCIGCAILGGIAILIAIGIGFYGWQFVKENIAFIQVAEKSDPSVETPPSVLLPLKVGGFTRGEVTDNLTQVPSMADLKTTGVAVGQYTDAARHNITVIAIPTSQAPQKAKKNPLMRGPGNTASRDVAVSVRDPYSGKEARTIVTWSKPNWTFMIQTSSTLANDFIQDFQPGTNDSITTETPVTSGTVETDPV